MSGVDNREYMYSLNANNSTMKLTVDFNIKTDPNTDQILAQMRQSRAASQLPSSQGVTVPEIINAIQAQQELYPTQHGQVQTQVGELNAVVQLYKALRAGWQEPATNSPSH